MTRVYEYDVFVSYRRIGSVPKWINNHFLPLLTDSLNDHLTHPVKIFLDQGTHVGSHWPTALESALLASKLLVPVCAPQYFTSAWCQAEWRSMELREQALGLFSRECPQGLIYPVLFCDSENFPDYARERQMWNLKPFAVSQAQYQETAEYLDLERAVREIAIDLADLLPQVPDWQPEWPVERPVPALPVPSRLPRFLTR